METIKARLNTMTEQNEALAPFGFDANQAKGLRSADSLMGSDVTFIAVIDGGYGYGYAIIDRDGVGRQAYYGKMRIINLAVA